MLIVDTPQFLEELNKLNKKNTGHQEVAKSNQTTSQAKKSFRDRLKNIFK